MRKLLSAIQTIAMIVAFLGLGFGFLSILADKEETIMIGAIVFFLGTILSFVLNFIIKLVDKSTIKNKKVVPYTEQQLQEILENNTEIREILKEYDVTPMAAIDIYTNHERYDDCFVERGYIFVDDKKENLAIISMDLSYFISPSGKGDDHTLHVRRDSAFNIIPLSEIEKITHDSVHVALKGRSVYPNPNYSEKVNQLLTDYRNKLIDEGEVAGYSSSGRAIREMAFLATNVHLKSSNQWNSTLQPDNYKFHIPASTVAGRGDVHDKRENTINNQARVSSFIRQYLK